MYTCSTCVQESASKSFCRHTCSTRMCHMYVYAHVTCYPRVTCAYTCCGSSACGFEAVSQRRRRPPNNTSEEDVEPISHVTRTPRTNWRDL